MPSNPKTTAPLTAQRLRELLSYDQRTGEFRRRRTQNYTHPKPIGTRRPDGYVMVWCAGKLHRANRLAWLYVKGEWPTELIDHDNGIRHDNSFKNLKEMTPSQNNKNKTVGPAFNPSTSTWFARIRLGPFDTQELAVAGYQSILKVAAEMGVGTNQKAL